MPKYRTIPTELAENPDMVNGGIEISGVLFWLALLVDDEGRGILDSAALARRFSIAHDVFERSLSYLVDHDFLQVYSVGRYSYYQVLRWERWQNLSEKTKTPSKYPAPPSEIRPDALPGDPGASPGTPGPSGEAPDKRREGEEKKSKENAREDEEAQPPPPNIVPFPAARADGDADPVFSEKKCIEATQQVAAILKVPVSESLQRVVADYLGDRSISLFGEADAAREWIEDARRNHRHQQLTPAFFRRWLKREHESAQRGSAPTGSSALEGAPDNARPQRTQARAAANGVGPPAAPGGTEPETNPYQAYVRERAQAALLRAQQMREEAGS